VLTITGTAASQDLTPQQDLRMELYFSKNPPFYIPHPSHPEIQDPLDFGLAIIGHSKRKTTYQIIAIIPERQSIYFDLTHWIFEISSEDLLSDNIKHRPHANRAPPETLR
jgi:hypothetical protein